MQILGIDVSKAKIDVSLRTGKRRYVRETFANDSQGHEALQRWLTGHHVQQVHACLEATGRYGDGLAHYLYGQGHRVSVVNPSRIHDYGKSQLRRNKSDALDADLIADFCWTQEPEAWQPPTASRRELQELTREITTLKADRQRKRNKLKSGISSSRLQRSLQRSIDFIDEEIVRLERELKELTRQEDDLKEDIKLLTSIPGIGFTTATRFLAEVDVARFQQAEQVAAYAGLIPRQFTSGSSVRKKPTLSKIGNRHLRNAFYMPALSAKRFNPIIHALVERLTLRGKEKMVIVGAVMRKLVHLAFGVLKTRKPFDPQYLNKIPVGA